MRNAARRIRQTTPIVASSSLYETAPVGFQNQPAYLNAVLEIDAPEDPRELHQFIQRIEADLGRKRMFANAPRTIDIDILLHGESVLKDEVLDVPHPRMVERAFVMVPLAEIAPDVVHPVLNRPISDLTADLGDTTKAVWVVAGPKWIDQTGASEDA